MVLRKKEQIQSKWDDKKRQNATKPPQIDSIRNWSDSKNKAMQKKSHRKTRLDLPHILNEYSHTHTKCSLFSDFGRLTENTWFEFLHTYLHF